jgi:hypothetical protein
MAKKIPAQKRFLLPQRAAPDSPKPLAKSRGDSPHCPLGPVDLRTPASRHRP